MKVDFRKLEVKTIEDTTITIDISKDLGNMLYMQGANIEECELGHEIYHKGEVELNEKQIDIVKSFADNFKYIINISICKTLGLC